MTEYAGAVTFEALSILWAFPAWCAPLTSHMNPDFNHVCGREEVDTHIRFSQNIFVTQVSSKLRFIRCRIHMVQLFEQRAAIRHWHNAAIRHWSVAGWQQYSSLLEASVCWSTAQRRSRKGFTMASKASPVDLLISRSEPSITPCLYFTVAQLVYSNIWPGSNTGLSPISPGEKAGTRWISSVSPRDSIFHCLEKKISWRFYRSEK